MRWRRKSNMRRGHRNLRRGPRNLRWSKSEDNEMYTKEQIECVFRSSDLNGKGKLSKKEVEKAFDKLGSRWPKYRAWRGRIHADADKDGFISLGAELDLLVDYTLKLGYHG